MGSYEGNGWGLYNMHGNVWEWCSDSFDEALNGLPGGRVVDPRGPSAGSGRVIRGGGWIRNGAWFCRSAFRCGNILGFGDDDIGFSKS